MNTNKFSFPVYSAREILMLGENIIAPKLGIQYKPIKDKQGFDIWISNEVPGHYVWAFSYLDNPKIFTNFFQKEVSKFIYSFLNFNDEKKLIDKNFLNSDLFYPCWRESEEKLYKHVVWHLRRTQHWEVQNTPPISELFK